MNSSTCNAKILLVTLIGLSLLGCERPPPESVQVGYRGTGMEQVVNPRILEQKVAVNVPPPATASAGTDGPTAGSIYQNVQVLGDLGIGQFNRLMVAMTSWVSPEEGCTYCHSAANFASDELYTKIVSRRMLQMTTEINSQWQNHVAQTGVTCYTCHRGKPVPGEVWFTDPGSARTANQGGGREHQNAAAPAVAMSSLPFDPFTPFFKDDSANIRVVSNTALPTGNRASTKQTEWTYGLMMHMSDALGVNCTFCHNTRAFADWSQSTPQRVTAWHGIEMVRALNGNYLEPLGPQYPENRLGPLGDAPKANCGTCHQGAYKPLYGASMLTDYPALAGPAAAGD
jgi:photosynthetic reaction center cytochrome c subunit